MSLCAATAPAWPPHVPPRQSPGSSLAANGSQQRRKQLLPAETTRDPKNLMKPTNAHVAILFSEPGMLHRQQLNVRQCLKPIKPVYTSEQGSSMRPKCKWRIPRGRGLVQLDPN